jgi:hypothetical protein
MYDILSILSGDRHAGVFAGGEHAGLKITQTLKVKSKYQTTGTIRFEFLVVVWSFDLLSLH